MKLTPECHNKPYYTFPPRNADLRESAQTDNEKGTFFCGFLHQQMPWMDIDEFRDKRNRRHDICNNIYILLLKHYDRGGQSAALQRFSVAPMSNFECTTKLFMK